MPVHGQSTGLIHFNEIIGSHPIVWDDEPTKKYFPVPAPTQEMASPVKKGRYFNVPAPTQHQGVPVQPVQQAPVFTYTKPVKPKHAGRYFIIPSSGGK
jgi:hypothetical protein